MDFGIVRVRRSRSVHLHSTKIGGHLDCSGGRFINIGACAILANHARILNGFLFRDGFEARGDVRLCSVRSREP
jgi:hypothetical protein